MRHPEPGRAGGTYPLPEAQLDRFLMQDRLGYPDHAAEVRVMQSEHGGSHVEDVPQVSDPNEVAGLIAAARTVHVAPAIFDYIASLVGTPDRCRSSAWERRRGARWVCCGRAGCGQHSGGRHYVVPSDVQALAGPVLGHRMLVSSAFEASGGNAVDAAAEAVSAVAAPPGDGQR